MTEADIAQAMKEILGARVVYVFACLHLARWISVRNNSEIKEKKKYLWSARSLRILPSWIYAPKNSAVCEKLGSRNQ